MERRVRLSEWEEIGVTNLTLLTDLYQLTMMGGYHRQGKVGQRSSFDLYFRKLPFQGGFCLACGLEPALNYLKNLRFDPPALDYLRSQRLFSADFLDWLAEFRFTGTVYAVAEGELVFPNQPLLRVEAPIAQAQLVESALLNLVNFHTLAATKAARVCLAAEGDQVLEFGLRRAQGVDGALAAARAAYAGGCHATSNVLAGQLFGIPVKGTHAHSWVMSFATEIEAFRAYAEAYPEGTTLLVDTYDTLASGVPNAIKVGLELQKQGRRLAGIRLDSGDLAKLSIQARAMLDQAGLHQTAIVASNDLDEYAISRLKGQGARINVWGVGTNLVTCRDEPALGGVYKLVAAENDAGQMEPRIKLSANPAKSTLPGTKQIYRTVRADGVLAGDILCLADESALPQPGQVVLHPYLEESWQAAFVEARPLLAKVMENGRVLRPGPTLSEIRSRSLASLETLPSDYRSLHPTTTYPVGLSQPLAALRAELSTSRRPI